MALFVSANELEKRLQQVRDELQEQKSEDDWDRAKFFSAYDTAVDVATCYPTEGGDIWLSTLSDEKPEAGQMILVAVANVQTMEKVGVYPAVYTCGFEIMTDGEQLDLSIHAVYAWCPLPDMPEVL